MITKIFAVLTLISSISFAQRMEFVKSLDCNWVDPIQTGFLQNHLVTKQKDSALQARVIEQYIKRQDNAKIYLLDKSELTKIDQNWGAFTKCFNIN